MEKTDNPILEQLELLEKKVINYINVKFDLRLTGKEIKIDLNGKNIGNIELELLSGIEFKNLEELNISSNNITNVQPLKQFKSPNLKVIDISNNPIENIDAIKEMKAKLKEINLKNTNILKKDIQDLKNIIIHGIDSKDTKTKECILKYEINNVNNLKNKLKEKEKSISSLLNDVEKLEKKLLEKNEESVENKIIEKNLDSNDIIKNDFEEIKKSLISEKISENSNLFIKFQNLEKKLLEILNLKLEVKLSDKEIKLDLNKKNIGNIELELLRGINFKNLEELDLSHNNISDITPLKDLKTLKKLDLSRNNIMGIKPIEDIKFKNLEKIDLSFNNISKLSKIDLSLNKINDLNDVKFLEKFKNIDILDFLKEIQNIKLKINNLLKDENIASNNKIRIFGEEFVKNNKNNCVIFINNKEKELSEFYEYAQNENVIFVRLKMNEKVNSFNEMFKDCSSLISFNEGNNWNLSNINDMSYMFYNCESLGFLSKISKWDTSNVINMDYLFYNCLSLIPFPDISKWNISKVKRKTDMFNGCSNVNIKILNKFK